VNKQQKELNKWFKNKGWEYWPPLSILARLMEETGELARLINHLYGHKPKKALELDQNLEDEIGDILYTLMCLNVPRQFS